MQAEVFQEVSDLVQSALDGYKVWRDGLWEGGKEGRKGGAGRPCNQKARCHLAPTLALTQRLPGGDSASPVVWCQGCRCAAA